ncbi:MAG: 16S rRNA (guanine(527)-N(7))-methyltransferase RsmG [Pseudomonadota bacterium]|nr:16S rRNA (guanine(527)-N(7))-methyltransferase RsmG [Pseudomonadota bacterium]
MVDAERELLHNASQEINLSLSGNQIDQLIAYADLLEKWNRAYNLTAIRDRREIFSRHLIESLSIASFVTGRRRLDVGTGAGLPGVPLAILEPSVTYVLLDSNGKKTRFLTEVKRSLGLSNIEVQTARVEKWHPDAPFDAIVTRAFADLATTCQRTGHVLAHQGMLFAMKTERANQEMFVIPDHLEQVFCWDIAIPGRDWPVQLQVIRRRLESDQ